MIKANSDFTIKQLYTGTTKNGNKYWSFSTPVYSYENGEQNNNGYVTIYCNGMPIASEGEKVYIHEIVGFDMKRRRNKVGSWGNYPRLVCVCGRNPLFGESGDENENEEAY